MIVTFVAIPRKQNDYVSVLINTVTKSIIIIINQSSNDSTQGGADKFVKWLLDQTLFPKGKKGQFSSVAD